MSKQANAAAADVVSFSVRQPNVEWGDEYARSQPSCAWNAVFPLHFISVMMIARLHRGP